MDSGKYFIVYEIIYVSLKKKWMTGHMDEKETQSLNLCLTKSILIDKELKWFSVK